MADDQESPFSVNDFDIEKGIFNLVIALVQQRKQRMSDEVARQSVIEYLQSLCTGLDAPRDNVGDKIQEFVEQQRTEDDNGS